MTPRRTIRARAAGPQRDQEVKGRIVAAAEHVFAEMGVEKATLRDITQRADVNVAAVSYYFGSKSDLVHSVFDQLSTRLNERRTRELDLCMAEAKRAGRPLDLRAVLEIFIRPYLDGKSGRLFARMILQHRLAPSEVTAGIISGHFDPMAKRFIAAIREACPDVDAKVFYWRYVFMIGSVVYSVADHSVLDRVEHLSGGRVKARDAAGMHEALIDFLAAGIREPSPSPSPSTSVRRRR